MVEDRTAVSTLVQSLVQSLVEICQKHLLVERWLLAPSWQAGQQWIESVAGSGQPVLNVRLKTLKSLALKLAAPAMAERRVTLASATVPAALGVTGERRAGRTAIAGREGESFGIYGRVARWEHHLGNVAQRESGLLPDGCAGKYWESSRSATPARSAVWVWLMVDSGR